MKRNWVQIKETYFKNWLYDIHTKTDTELVPHKTQQYYVSKAKLKKDLVIGKIINLDHFRQKQTMYKFWPINSSCIWSRKSQTNYAQMSSDRLPTEWKENCIWFNEVNI